MMFPTSGIVVVVVFWVLLFLLDAILRKSRRYGLQYNETLRDYGFSLSLAQIRWQTSMFNRLFMKAGRLKPRLLLFWFNLGAVFGSVSMLLSMVLLAGMLYKSVTQVKPEQILQPVMPGMNLPWSQVSYYVVTLMIAGAFHEVGHAIAAVRENVRVNSFGLFLLFVYPGAFVELHTDQLEIITPVRKLRIYTAGVWHNCVLALAAFLFSTALPYIFLPLYSVNQGVTVVWIAKECSIRNSLPVGDIVTSVNHYPILSSTDWYKYINSININPVKGYCNTRRYVKAQNTSLPVLVTNFDEPDCCNDTSSYRFCFYCDSVKYKPTYTAKRKDRNRLLRTSGEFIAAFREHACLPARQAMSLKQSCQSSRDCTKEYDHDMLCLKPLTRNVTKVIRIAHKKGQDILFVGDPRELTAYIMFSDYISKYPLSFTNSPEHLHTLSMYLLSISSALAILNMVPCFFLDGHQTLCALLEMIFPNAPIFRSLVEPIILFLGSLLLLVNILLALYSLVSPG